MNPAASLPAHPLATYRLQLRPDFGFDAAAGLCAYLSGLGVSHLYLSPCFEAVAGSEHGYDVTDPTRLRAELGGSAGFDRLIAAAGRHDLRLLLDVVPNHMATDPAANRWWRDLLEDGRASPVGAWFDVAWETEDAELHGRVLAPVLSAPLGAALDRGALTLRRRGGEVELAVAGGPSLPLRLPSLAPLLAEAAAAAQSEALNALGVAAAGLAAAAPGDAEGLARRAAARRRLHQNLEAACRAEPGSAAALDAVLRAAGADRGRLRGLLDAQVWLLDDWHRESWRLNLRRFFAIGSLVGFRVDVADAFAASHRLAVELVRRGAVDGLRVDHVDGLRDPARYLDALALATGGAWVVVEKILEAGESLPEGWAMAGTTGYEVAADLAAASIDRQGATRMRRLRDRLCGARPGFKVVARQARHEVVTGALRADVTRLLGHLRGAAAAHPALAAVAPATLRRALEALLVAFPVYRSYVDPAGGSAAAADRAAVAAALAAAREADAGVSDGVLEAVAELLEGRGWGPGGAAAELCARFQQLTPAVAAKGVEDCAIYRDLAVLALDEVGCGPSRPLLDSAGLGAALAARMATPLALSASTTHDSKRSEDVRARLCVLTELAGEWEALAPGLVDRALGHGGDPPPDAGTALLLVETLVAAWPIDVERAVAYLRKAAREAGERTTWTAPDAAYEAALEAMVRGLLGDACVRAELEGFVAARLRRLGAAVATGWALLRGVAPGVLDLYQGCELVELSLVDPDNRRPVDFELRRRLLERARQASAGELAADLAGGPGLAKLAVLVRVMELRRRRPLDLGPAGACAVLPAAGPGAAHAVALSRGTGPGVVAVATRLPAILEAAGGWGTTRLALPRGRWRDLLGGAEWAGEVAVAELLGWLPVALLERAG